MKTTSTETTTDIKTALLNANGQTVKHGDRRYRLECESRYSRYYNRDEFSCHAMNLTPKDETEAKFCLTDLWRSESDDSARLMVKFAKLGGWKERAE